MKHWREASLKIDNPVAAQIFGLLIGDALQRFFGLHHCDGVREALQIFRKAALIRSAKKPLGKCLRGVCRKVRILSVSSQINHGLRPQHTVQVLVQKDFGKALQ